MSRLWIGGVCLLAAGWLTVTAPPELGAGPWRHCVQTTQLNCYLTGDVPPGAVIVWSGPEADIPK